MSNQGLSFIEAQKCWTWYWKMSKDNVPLAVRFLDDPEYYKLWQTANLSIIDDIQMTRFLNDVIEHPNLFAHFQNNLQGIKAWEALSASYRTNLNYLHFFERASVRDSRDAILNTNIPQQLPNLDIEDLTAIHHYTNIYHHELNTALRNGALNAHLSGFNSALNAALDKLPNWTTSTYRGSSMPESLVLSKYKTAFDNNQSSIIEEAFTSTSTSPVVANSFANDLFNNDNVKVFFTIHGNKGKNIDNISLFGPNFGNSAYSESEVLFKSNSSFNVTGYEDVTNNGERIIFITLTEL